MARNHGKIETGFWQNRNVRALSEDARLLLLYLYSSPHSTAAGCYVLPAAYIAHDLNWPSERVAKGFRDLSVKPFVLRDPQTEVTLIYGWWEHNAVENKNVALHICRLLLSLPNSSLKDMAIKEFRQTCTFTAIVAETLKGWVYEPSQEALPLSFGNGPEAVKNEPLDNPSGTLTERYQPEPSLTGAYPSLTEPEALSRPPRSGKGSRLTTDWHPGQPGIDYAKKLGLTSAETETVAERFVRWWTGPDAKSPMKKDWHRTWCNWLDRDAPDVIRRRPRNGAGHAEQPSLAPAPPADIEQWTARLGMFERTKIWVPSWGPRLGERGCEVPAELAAKPPDPGGPAP